MSQSKITEVQPNGSFVYQQGPLAGKTGYGFIYKFEDGTDGRCVHMTEQPKFNVGDTVEIEEAGNDPQGNRKVKLSRQGGGNFRGGSGGGGYDGGVGVVCGMASKEAVRMLCYNKAKPLKGESLRAFIVRIGSEIVEADQDLVKKYTPAKPASQQQQSNQNQSQPEQQDEDDMFDEDDVPF